MWGRMGARPLPLSVMVPTNNPLAMKWGSTQTLYLNDGLGQGNNIAVFPSFVNGICAQLDLWRSSPRYRNKRFADDIAVWSGGNSVESYINFVLTRVPGMTRNTIMDDTFWRGPMCIPFLKAQAWHEAGRQYPAVDDDWIEAKQHVLGGTVIPMPVPPPPDVPPVPAPAQSGWAAFISAIVSFFTKKG